MTDQPKQHRMTVRHQHSAPGMAPSVPQPSHEDPIAKAIASVTATRATMDAQAIQLSDGRTVELALPQRSVAALTTMIAAELIDPMQEASPSARIMALSALQPQVEALLYVRSIDGERIMVGNATQYKAVADRLTDAGIRAVLRAIQQHWPPASADTLPLVKKNMQ